MTLAPSAGWYEWFAAWARSSILNDVWFQNLILAASAAIGILTISSSARQERRRAVVDIARDQDKDEILLAARKTLRSLVGGSGKIDVDTILKAEDSDQLRAIYTVLNSYEFVANGLRTGAFDEKTYKRMYYNTVVTHWSLLREFVEKYREKYRKEYAGVDSLAAETLCQDFEALATNWARHPLKRLRSKQAFETRSSAAATPSPVPQSKGAAGTDPAQKQQAPPPDSPKTN
jgi:hypothetical protein